MKALKVYILIYTNINIFIWLTLVHSTYVSLSEQHTLALKGLDILHSF